MSAPTGGEAPPLPAATRGGAAVAGAGSGSGLAGSRDAGAKPSTATSKKATTPDELPPHLRAKYDKLEASYLALLRRAAAFAASEEGKPRHAGPSCEHGAPVPTYDKTKGEVVHEGRGGVAEDGEDGADADADVVAAARRMLPARRPLVLQVDESGGPEELKISTVADPSHSASDGTGRGAEEVKPSPAKRSVETEPLDLVPLELLMQFRALQERRSRTYSAFEEGFRDLLESGSFEPYAELVQRVTAAFAEVSKDVRAIEAALKARGATSEASLLRSIQDQEKAKLHLVGRQTAEMQMMRQRRWACGAALMRADAGEGDKERLETATAEVEAKLAQAKDEHDAVVATINDLLEEVKYAAAELMDD